MNQSERRQFLIRKLLDEKKEYKDMKVPSSSEQQKYLLRSLMNVRWAAPISDEFARVQDEYLKEVNDSRGVAGLSEIKEYQPEIYIWQGDITRLKVGAIVNAANSGMTGCYRPCHACIDNCIHTYAGIELRNYCDQMMQELARRNGGYYEEPTGQAKITPAFNLPCDYVIHTVGPIVEGRLTDRHEELLASCYHSCLEIADQNQVGSIAFCCISTGVFMFPNDRAAQIAVKTVKKYKQETGSHIKVIFNVFKDMDLKLYEKFLV